MPSFLLLANFAQYFFNRINMSRIKLYKSTKQSSDRISRELHDFIQSKMKQNEALKKVILELDKKNKKINN